METDQTIRLTVVGTCGVGKTSLVNNLIDDFQETMAQCIAPTEGIEVHKCNIFNSTWKISETTRKQTMENQSIIKDPKLNTNTERHENKANTDNFQVTNYLSDHGFNKWAAEMAGKLPTISVWDFAGQNIYYSTHHFLLHNRSIYLLLVDISQDLYEETDDCSHFYNVHGRFTCIDAFKFWLINIYLYSEKNSTTMSPASVFLVGTHKDKLSLHTEEEKENYKEFYFQELLKPFLDFPKIRDLVQRKKFLVNNLEPNSLIFGQIRQAVFNCASSKDHWNKKIPKDWIKLEKCLNEKIKKTKGDVISFEDVVKAGKEISCQMSEENEIRNFLRRHHAIGNLLYFETKELKNVVILDPVWAILAFKSFTNHIHDRNPSNIAQFVDFENCAILKPCLIEEIMLQADPRVKPFKDQVKWFLEKLDVIVQPVCCENITEDTKVPVAFSPKTPNYLQFYVVPCLLKKAPLDSVWEKSIRHDTSQKHFVVKSPVLCFVFNDAFMAPAVFHRLQATCIRNWEIAKIDSEKQLYNGVGVFLLNRTFRFTLSYVDHIIYCQMWGMSFQQKSLFLSLRSRAGELREVLTKALTEITDIVPSYPTRQQKSNRGQTIKPFEECIQCRCTSEPGKGLFRKSFFMYTAEDTCTEGRCGNHLISREFALRVWFNEDLQKIYMGQI